MSLYDMQDLIEIKLYYRITEHEGTKLLFILEDDDAKERLKSEESSDISVLTTKWSQLSWQEQNSIIDKSHTVNTQTGEINFNQVKYRDGLVKQGLKDWDLEHKEQRVPVTAQAIDKLPSKIVSALFQKYEKILSYSEADLKN